MRRGARPDATEMVCTPTQVRDVLGTVLSLVRREATSFSGTAKAWFAAFGSAQWITIFDLQKEMSAGRLREDLYHRGSASQGAIL
jgi:hypothetical protein